MLFWHIKYTHTLAFFPECQVYLLAFRICPGIGDIPVGELQPEATVHSPALAGDFPHGAGTEVFLRVGIELRMEPEQGLTAHEEEDTLIGGYLPASTPDSAPVLAACGFAGHCNRLRSSAISSSWVNSWRKARR